jgi:hypothetical protein
VRKEIPDALLPGLYFVVQPSGAKSWAVRYRHGKRSRKHTLGPFPRIDLKVARDLARTALRAAAEGRDPASERAQARAAMPDSLEHAVEQFIERHVKRNYRPRSMREAERLLRVHVIAAWRDRALTSITRRDVRDMLEKIVERGAPVMANRVHSVRKFFGWCLEHEIIAASPLTGIKQPAEETSRDRILLDDELRMVWRSAGEIGRAIRFNGEAFDTFRPTPWRSRRNGVVGTRSRKQPLDVAKCSHEKWQSPFGSAKQGRPRRHQRSAANKRSGATRREMGRDAVRLRPAQAGDDGNRGRDHRFLPRPACTLQGAEIGRIRTLAHHRCRQDSEIRVARAGACKMRKPRSAPPLSRCLLLAHSRHA